MVGDDTVGGRLKERANAVFIFVVRTARQTGDLCRFACRSRLARSDGFIRFDHALKYLRQQGALHEIILWFYHAMSVLPKKTLVFFTLIYHTISIHRAQENN